MSFLEYSHYRRDLRNRWARIVRLFTLFIIITVTFALTVLLYLDYISMTTSIVIVTILMVFVFVTSSLRYLDTGSAYDIDAYGIHYLTQELKDLKKDFAAKAALTEDDRADIKRQVSVLISDDIEQKIAASVEERLRESPPEKNLNIIAIRVMSDRMQQRLVQEIDALGRRANLNLVIGVVISLLALMALAYFVYVTGREMTAELEAGTIALRFAIRLSLVIFMQIFAYFFLRLYRTSLFEIKYFQNELTGSQFRLMALETALAQNSADTVKKLVADFTKTERNVVIRKGEISLAHEREKIERDYDKSMFALLERALERDKKEPA